VRFGRDGLTPGGCRWTTGDRNGGSVWVGWTDVGAGRALRGDSTRPWLCQLHEPAEGRLETTCVDVETLKVFVEANVQELTTGGLRSVTGGVNDADTDAAVPVFGVDHHVLDERVDQAVPEHVREADEALAVSCDDPAQAVPLGLVDPVMNTPRKKEGWMPRLRTEWPLSR
jgi:hypothetical protein